MENNIVLEVKNITKEFPGVKALDDVSMSLKKGEVHALLGMNGSGKSTLLKIITGVYKADEGQVFVDGQEMHFDTVLASRHAGISMVFQELSLVPGLTVAENIFMGHMPLKNKLISYKEAKRLAKELLDSLNLDIDPTETVENLTVAEKQMVEIAKALSIDTKVLLLDEPSAVLTQTEIKSLFEIIRSIKASGITVVYISHRLEEVFEIADTVTVLKDGVHIATRPMEGLDSAELIRMMIGRSMDNMFPELQYKKTDEIVMKVDKLNNYRLKDISFKLRKGEMLGIYGVVGSGQREFAEALFGVDTKDMQIEGYEINGKPVKINTPVDAVNHGLAYIPEERKHDGLMLRLSVKENVSIPFIDRLSSPIKLVDGKKEKKTVKALIDKLSIKTPSQNVLVNNLSGGNQQKVVIAKWLGRESNIFICFEPTRGIDVEAKMQVYEALEELRRGGDSIIIVSSELTEVLGMSDRLYIMRKGRFLAEINRDEFDEERILANAAGVEV